MKLHLLPIRTAGATENMALDFLLLQRYPHAAAARFRHYEWRSPAFTFGYSQKIGFVRANVPPGEHWDLCRRPTGGGIVDHRNDWTYALVLPRGHALYDERAAQSYRIVHECLAEALASFGQPAEVKRECDPEGKVGPDLRAGQSLLGEQAPPEGPPAEASTKEGICFQRAELYDVVQPATGTKIAGAAQKRNKHGLLFQGSIDKGAVGAVDWDAFQAKFAAKLAGALALPGEEVPWPELDEDEVGGLVEQYSATEWIEYR